MHDIDTLVQHYLEGTLTDAEAEALHDLLKAQPELGASMLDHFEMDAMLRATRPIASTFKTTPVITPKRRFTITALSVAAAIAACVTLVGAWVIHSLDGARPADEETTAAVAVLTRGVNLQFETDAIAPGTPLSPGLLKLKAGIAQIEFYQGARVVLEGPASLQLISSGEATCMSGRLSAHVPPQAKGFRINTPKGAVVDLGTEFGLDVSDSTAEVHVFKGEVELHPASSAMQALKQGQAMAFADVPQPLTANAAAFASLNEIDRRTADSQRSQFEQWQAGCVERNLDPAMRVHFDFQDAEELRSLRNHAANGAMIADGSIVGGSWTEGRWPGKRALEFRNVSDRVRLGVPGEMKALTMCVWVRVNGLDRTFNSLFMSEGWGDRRVHWQIVREGKVRLGVAGRAGQSHADYDSPVLFTPEKFGRWMHLAVSFDPVKREICHYADGDLVARLQLRDAAPLKIGMAELGNWNDRRSPGSVAIRHLSGAMEEFSIHERVLSPSEIARLAR